MHGPEYRITNTNIFTLFDHMYFNWKIAVIFATINFFMKIVKILDSLDSKVHIAIGQFFTGF